MDDVIGTALFQEIDIAFSPFPLSCSPAATQNRPFDPVTTPVCKYKNTRRTSQSFLAKSIRDRVPHDMDPHIDLVFSHGFGKNQVKLLSADLIVPFLNTEFLQFSPG